MLNKVIFIISITLLSGNQPKEKQTNLDITLSLISVMSEYEL